MFVVEGNGVGVGNGRVGFDFGVENSDEYWNILIDGKVVIYCNGIVC